MYLYERHLLKKLSGLCFVECFARHQSPISIHIYDKILGPFYLRLRNTTFMRGLLETRNENYPAWASRVFQVTLIFNKVVNKHMIRLTHSHVATTKQDHQ